MTTVRSAKTKGAQFELSCRDSLQQCYHDIVRWGGEGYSMQWDLYSKEHMVAIECKRLAGISWNELVKFYEKLVKQAPAGVACFVLFQSNRQPPLVFYKACEGKYWIAEFKTIFGVPFLERKNKAKREAANGTTQNVQA
jgi:hypothetical protein